MSPEKVLLPQAPSSARLFEGNLDDWFEAELAREYQRGHTAALDGACDLIAQAAKRIDQAREEAADELAAFAARFSESIAKHLIHVELNGGRHAIEKMVRETLAQSGVGRGRCIVHVHPEDAATLSSVTFRSLTEIESDPEVARGSVHVSTSEGLLVRDIDVCIQHAAERIHQDSRRQSTSADSDA